MSLRDIVKETQKYAVANSPAILTAIGVTGTLTTAYLTGKASFRAVRVIDREQLTLKRKAEAGEPLYILDTKQQLKIVWKMYIPAASAGALTVFSIVYANRIGSRRAAAVAAAYTLSEKAFSEYKDKVVETIGKNKAQKVRDDIAQDRVTANPVGSQQVIITGGGDVLCMDSHTGRYFQSSMETLKQAQNDINYQILNHDYASLTDFYNKIALPSIPTSDNLGWNTDKSLELMFTTAMSEDNKPCLVVSFLYGPYPNYFRAH